MPATIRNRIKTYKEVKAKDLHANPRNWRVHPERQKSALRGFLEDVGYVDALICREAEDGTLLILDGHLRAETTPDQLVPVLVIDVSEEEADKVLASLDPLALMAEADQGKLAELLERIDLKSDELQSILEELAGVGGEDVELKQLDVKPPPKMAWVLVGIPVVRFAEIAADVEKLASIPEVICEMTVNDGQGNEDR